MMIDQFDFTQDGFRFRARILADEFGDSPWENDDGVGVVSEWTRRAKRPGEMTLARDREKFRYYDFAATMRRAVAEGWSAAPHDQGTRRQRAARAVIAEFQRLRAWCNDEWHYVGVSVRMVNADGEEFGEAESLWHIESDATDYHRDVASELADSLSYAAKRLTVSP